ncbi:hypothetical protein Tco_0414647 [Tanacetum coccineum]
MMTYLKHVGGKKHSDLKTKSFEEIQVLYEKIKRSDDSFIAIGSAEDEKMIKEMNEQAVDASKKASKEDTVSREKLKKKKELEKESLYDETEELEDVYLNVVTRSNRKRRYFSTLMTVLSILDRDDICAIYQLVMNSSSRINTVMTDEGLVIHILVENKYPLTKKVLSKLLELKLETKKDSTMALELIRFVKKQIAELEPKDSDGDERIP